MTRPATRLYLLTPPEIELESFAPVLDATLAAGDVASLQLRLKPASDAEIISAVETLMPIAHAHDVAFILNDRADLAKQLDCDGVHLGQDDMDYASARALLGDDKIIGITCHNSRHMAMLAGEAGADYVAFGAFYETQTKQAKTSAPSNILTWWQEMMQPPCVAIGGITPKNAEPLIMAGADFIAASSGVWQHPGGPEAGVVTFNKLFASLFTRLEDTLSRDA
ncbi:MAG: thiamine phosphate synthase [Alphaproteobacteria bacterium]|nr:thiamine phosphate synthase [Alphaproteobacteria bacterium]